MPYSLSRREGRYRRRREKRLKNRQVRSDAVGSIGTVFSFRNLFFFGRKCCNGVRWKQSTQNFELHLFLRTGANRKALLDRKWKPKKCSHFILRERGKVRPIDAPHINDRQIHKVLCNKVLIPLYTPSMIYDNGASQLGKGLHWQIKRLKRHLLWHYRHYGRAGCVLLMDLRKFFPNANHALLYQRHKDFVLNHDLREVADTVIRYSPTQGKGLPLGVEPSQQEMVSLPSAVDNWIKCQLGIRCVGHYMDDYYLILPDIQQAKKLKEILTAAFETKSIPVSPQKCHIVPLTKSFRWCKCKFTLTPSGAVKTNGCRDGIKRARRKFKLFARQKRWDAAGVVFRCQKSYYLTYNDNGRVLKLNRIYHSIIERSYQQCMQLSKTM